MKEHLVKIQWFTSDGSKITEDNEWFEVNYDESTDEVLFIKLEGLTEMTEMLIYESGWDFLNDEDYKKIREHIISINDISKKSINELLNFKHQYNGEFFVVVHIDGFKSNHPEDPTEWDIKTTFLGVLGKDVKFSY